MATRRNIRACRCLALSSPISTMPSRLPVQSANWSSPCQCCTSFAVFPRGNYQMYNGKHREHKVWAPRRVKGWKLSELVEAKGQIGTLEADGSREVLCSRGIHRQNNPGGGPKPVTSPCAVPAWLDTYHDSSLAKRRCALPPLPEVRGPRAHVFMDGLDEGMFPRCKKDQ